MHTFLSAVPTIFSLPSVSKTRQLPSGRGAGLFSHLSLLTSHFYFYSHPSCILPSRRRGGSKGFVDNRYPTSDASASPIYDWGDGGTTRRVGCRFRVYSLVNDHLAGSARFLLFRQLMAEGIAPEII